MLDIAEQMNHQQTRQWQDVVAKYAKLSNYKKALDIGTSSGLSAYTIAKAGQGHIISIDILALKGGAELAEFYGYGDRVTFLQTRSDNFFLNNTDMFDFICVDGSHKRAEVFEDCENSWKVLNKGGYIVFDDYNHPRLREDVGYSVDAFAKKYNLTLIKESDKAIIHKV